MRNNVFIVGERRDGSPEEPCISGEKMRECIHRAEAFLKRNQEERMERTLETISIEEKRA